MGTRHGLAWIAVMAAAGISLAGADASTVRAAGHAEATGPRAWTFPADHGSHEAFQTEWWYFTGNLAATDGSAKPFGYQFTIFRRALGPDEGAAGSAATTAPVSRWRSRHAYLSHVAVTDVSGARFHQAGRMLRPALGMAGASTATLSAKVDSTTVEPVEGTTDTWRLRAREVGFAFDLNVRMAKPLVFHGPGGRDAKGPRPEQASYYYSMSRLETSGTVTAGTAPPTPVRGTSWMDHEFGSNQLGKEQTGWDWFSLQLADGTELMLYDLRLKSGGVEPESGGTFVDAGGTTTALAVGAYRIEVLGRWKSPASGGTYPARWRVTSAAGGGIDLTIAPRLADQELKGGGPAPFTYWEGAVAVTGTRAGRPVSGYGYVELTGYAESMSGRL